jgi:hypothetical protein
VLHTPESCLWAAGARVHARLSNNALSFAESDRPESICLDLIAN